MKLKYPDEERLRVCLLGFVTTKRSQKGSRQTKVSVEGWDKEPKGWGRHLGGGRPGGWGNDKSFVPN